LSDQSMPQPSADVSQQASVSEPKRAPRKSKTDALAALHRSSSFGHDDFVHQENSVDFTPTPLISVSPSLDLSSVKTSSPRTVVPANSRPFGLEDCPVFYPTSEEFKDPMVYIRSISERAQKIGICKVVPPVGWKMPFVTDTEVCPPLPLIRPSHELTFYMKLEFSFQNSSSTTQLHRSLLSSQSKLSRTTLPFSQTTGKSSCRCSNHQPQAVRSVAFT
jgi:hypothetical protein